MFFHRRAIRRPILFQIRNKGWLLVFIFVMVMTLVGVYVMEKKMEPMLLAITKTELKKVAQEAVLNGVKEVASTQKVGELMEIEKDQQGKISMVKIDSRIQAKLYSHVTNGVQQQLKNLNNQHIQLSFGQLLQSPILSDYGPKIPIRIWPKGASKVSLVPKIEPAGINTVLVRLSLQVHSELGVVVPFSKESTTVDITYPLGEVLVMGEVPEYYFYSNGGEVKTLPTLPVPKERK